MHIIRGQGKQVSLVAWTGIAANLLIDGRTYHSQFGLPVPLVENSVSRITGDSVAGKILKETSLIIWDESTVAPFIALDAVNRLVKELKNDKNHLVVQLLYLVVISDKLYQL